MMTFKRFQSLLWFFYLGLLLVGCALSLIGGKDFGIVDVNTADINELNALPYITPAAQAIIDGR